MQQKISAPAEQQTYQNIVRIAALILGYCACENSRRDKRVAQTVFSICDFVQRPFFEAFRNCGTKTNSSPAAMAKHIFSTVVNYLISRRPNSLGSSSP